MKKIIVFLFFMLVNGGIIWADVIVPEKKFQPITPPKIHCADGYCVALAPSAAEPSHKILYIGIGAGILLLGGAGVVLLRKKHKK